MSTELFTRESGQYAAVTKELMEILGMTRVVTEKMKTDPPPRFANRLAGAGYYSLVGRAAPVEQIKSNLSALPKKDKE
jgi:hypothetical protein